MFQRVLGADIHEQEIAIRDGERFALNWQHSSIESTDTNARVRPVDSAGESASLRFGKSRALSDFYYIASPRRAPAPNEIEIQIAATGLNFKDLLKATGRIEPQATEGTYFKDSIGLECSGTVSRIGNKVSRFKPGDRVCAFPATDAFATYAIAMRIRLFPRTLVLNKGAVSLRG